MALNVTETYLNSSTIEGNILENEQEDPEQLATSYMLYKVGKYQYVLYWRFDWKTECVRFS